MADRGAKEMKGIFFFFFSQQQQFGKSQQNKIR